MDYFKSMMQLQRLSETIAQSFIPFLTPSSERHSCTFISHKAALNYMYSTMASVLAKSPGDGRYDRYHKYESIRIEWSNHFKKSFPKQEPIVFAFFKNFHRNHRGFQFVVAELFDGTTHVLVHSEKYAEIKEELEQKTGQSLPDVSNVSDVKVKQKGRSFPDLKSYSDFSLSLKAANDRIKAR